jgi:hypothetical protein
VIHLKVDIPSLRLLIDSELEKAEWAKVRYEVWTTKHDQWKKDNYNLSSPTLPKRMVKIYDKKVRPWVF